VTKVHKITLLIVDHDGLGAKEIINVLEGQRYPNHCIVPDVMRVESREVEWSDAHPLNQRATQAEAFLALFAQPD
jgi:hypothetical protein